MKHTSKRNAGFTLIELVVAMAIAVVVTAAATTVLLMGLRVNRQSADTASQQMTVRTLLSVMEDMASEGNIKEVVSNVPAEEGQPEQYGSWMLKDKDDRTVFWYNATEQMIYTNDVPVLEGVIASNAIMEGQLLSISIETEDAVYTSSIYCRTAEPADKPNIDALPGIGGDTGREKVIKVLKSQYRSRGEIRVDGEDSGVYYSQWYCGGTYWTGWNERTPWCACFVSWALDQVMTDDPDYCNDSNSHDGHSRWYANVDDFKAFFLQNNAWTSRAQATGEKLPAVGDLIFFDMVGGSDNDPSHVGAVLSISGNTVTTIEGNSADMVAIREYSLNDTRILGYGDPWAAVANQKENSSKATEPSN